MTKPIVEAVDISVDAQTVIDVTPVPKGDPIPWVEVSPDEQGAFDQLETVVAVCVVDLGDGRTVQHNIYELKGQYWASGIDLGPTPPAAPTIEEVKALVQDSYLTDYTPLWVEYMQKYPPPKV